MTHLVAHLLALYIVLASPWLGCVVYEKARKRLRAGDSGAKVGLYRDLVTEEVILTAVVAGLWWSGKISASQLGLCAPRSWALTAAVMAVFAGWLVWSAIRLRPKAERIRKRYQDSMGLLFPDSPEERRWIGVISAGAGISEELVFRGFLMYYLSAYVPHINTAATAVCASLIFGLAHIYQGRMRGLAVAIIGLVFAGLYLLSGSLVLPMVIHAVMDYRALLIFPPNAEPAVPVENAA